MLQQFLSTILTFFTGLFGANAPLPPTGFDLASPTATLLDDYIDYMGMAECFSELDLYDQGLGSYNDFKAELSTNIPKPNSPTPAIQLCGDETGQAILRATNEPQDQEPYSYTLTFTDLKKGSSPKDITFTQNFQAYGRPSCRIEDISHAGYSETGDNLSLPWEKILVDCAIGDGGFSAQEQYSINLSTGQVDQISRCDSRPLAILDSSGTVAHLDYATDCTYPFGTAEDSGIPYGNDGLE
jgi:hypothetical protein